MRSETSALGARKIWNKILLIIALLAISIFGQVWAYNYSFDNKTLYIEDSFKGKVDLFVSKKILSKTTANKYITALQKINYSRLNANKQNIYDYLYFKLKSYGEAVKTINSVNSTNLAPSTNYTDSGITFSSNYEKDYIQELIKYTKDNISVDSQYIFNRNWKQNLLSLEKYYIVDIEKPINLYLDIPTINNEVLFEKWGNFYISKSGYSFEQKLEISDIKSKVKLYSESSDSSIFEIKDWYYYAYNLHKYKYIPIPETWIFLSQYSPVPNLSENILLYKNWNYYLVIEFETVKLFKSTILDNISNKQAFLWYFSKDLFSYTGSDIETQLEKIKNKSLELTQNSSTQDEKISNIYSRITSNIKYDDFSLDFIKWKYSEDYFMKNVNYEVFSGVWAFKNKQAVCDWYSHLFLYMLYFSGIENASIEWWQALINSKRISHSWNKIWEYYYDSTWDIDSLWDKSLFEWYKTPYDKFFVLRKSL
ncbi:MAG: hypothetical protein ACD_49C00027G0002 [uncultured bacterium (gcode 4)]|uniref:Transglutaminase-like domain-containing protein n=1 Tax=uncultured bacterium (gcode 4) TaxID=1234023 RepID=K2AF54_9BACT|nr:MAG: hypothetical protein ACD_49C00027G0002 [uncultured bacterium (gcode 4)]